MRTRNTWIPPVFHAAPAPIPDARRDYILVLVRLLEKRVNETGSLDESLADHIELLMHTFWPDQIPAPPIKRGTVECEPQPAVTEDGFCEWVCPTPTGYLMQCCDCGLIHEAEFRVAKYAERPSEEFVVADDPNLQAQFRMRRRDDLSPKDQDASASSLPKNVSPNGGKRDEEY